MGNRLEDFIKKNKAAFDDQEPSAALWKRLEKKIQKPDPEPVRSVEPAVAKVVKINWWKWTAAAMILITAGVLSKPYWKPDAPASGGPGLAIQKSEPAHMPAGTDSNEHTTNSPVMAYDETHRPSSGNDPKKEDPHARDLQTGNEVKEELFHYTRLIEIKQKEIATLKNNYPELFEQFSEDLTTLDRSYTTLKHKYDEGLNSEQLLTAMIENLKLQTELLNKQLEITKKLKQQKNEASYKNI
ncbi:anti-sigma factor [Niabella drilacis]|uniref:Anti-sigma factor n=1 Tax=Niabella drilacis (strain DSM 25811 / CCM 8410 / CCUG 62505 / LMG 26954 / E90) TaxID=1285928 RepID=A0A1G7AVW6_NIADE|nr:anti-sigma factor [Niabella drilacis]SDE19014.1 hypothetical protein SAMN04487894_12543 [Niabella drilacis]